ncbi:MAG: Rne/Rng family ribonuclease [Kiritimatiellae bacterium]|nr:Rne/Rng family ribonuclease [Kiritimatiellia bacterium]
MFGKNFLKFKWVTRVTSHLNREIVINAGKLETRVAVLENGRLEDYQIEHPGDDRLVGSIFRGRIQNLQDDLQAAFVHIGMKKNAFLHYWDMNPDEDSLLDDDDGSGDSSGEDEEDSPRGRGGDGGRRKKAVPKRLSNEEIAKRFPAGSVVTVQVSKGPIGTKGPRITASLSIPGRYLVLMPGGTLRGVSRKIGDAEERKRLKKILDKLQKFIPKDCGLIVRTAGQGVSHTGFVRDLRVLVNAYADMKRNIQDLPAPACVYEEPDLVMRVVRDWMTEDVDRIVVDDPVVYERLRKECSRISRHARNLVQRYDGNYPIFDHYGVETQLEEAFRRKVPLKSGGYLVIDETEALIAVDVNTGRHKGKGSQEDAILEVNLEAVEEVARQLRIRNIGGLVVLDLIDMKSRKHQQQVYRALRNACRRDKARTNITPISELGLLEMTRQRFERSLLSQTRQACPYCRGHGVVKSPLQLSADIQRRLRSLTTLLVQEKKEVDLQICVHPSVLERIRNEDGAAIREIQSGYGARLSFKSEPLRQAESFAIADAQSGQVIFAAGEQATF